MVNAASDISHGNEFYKEGTKLPEHLVKEFEISDPSLLGNYIEINGKWIKIDDKGIEGFVKEGKTREKRLRDYFGIKEEKPKEEDKSHMLRARPKKEKPKESKYTKEELQEKSFSQLRKIGYKLGTKGRGVEELVKEILELQNAR